MKRAPSDPLSLRAARIGTAQRRADSTAFAIAVIERFELVDYVQGLLLFIDQVKARGLGDCWLSSFSKTLFLAGRVQRCWLNPLLDVSTNTAGWVILHGERELKQLTGRLAPLALHGLPPTTETTIHLAASKSNAIELVFEPRDFTLLPFLVAMTHLIAEARLAGDLDHAGSLVIRTAAAPLTIRPSDLGVRALNSHDPRAINMALRHC